MRRLSVRRGRSLERIYVDDSVLYYLTAHYSFGGRAEEHLERFGGLMVTSSLTAWLLHVLTRLENVASILEEIGVELAPLDSGVLREAEKLDKPGDFEDRIHLATAKRLGITKILTSDRDFDGITGILRIF